MPGRNGLAILKVTDGITSVSLLNNVNGFGLKDWRPALAGLRGSGSWHEGPFMHGRRLIHYNFENVVDTFDLTVNGVNQDMVIAETRALRQLLQKGRDYWVTRWANEPVWIEARGSGETQTRYAFIQDWSNPNDANPYTMPFFNCGGDSLNNDLTLIVEHSIWQDSLPSTAACIPVNSYKTRPVNYLNFDGASDYIDLLSPASLDNLPSADMTAEAWVRINPSDLPTNPNVLAIVSKGSGYVGTLYGWALYINQAGHIAAVVDCATSPATASGGTDISDGLWHHVAMTWDFATRTVRVWLDGVNDTSVSAAGVGGYNGDSLTVMYIGNDSQTDYFSGDMGWVRVTASELYTAGFSPPPRWKLPEVSTIGVWVWEGYGVTIYNLLITGDNGQLYGRGAAYQWQTDYNAKIGYLTGADYGITPVTPTPVGGCDPLELFFVNSHNYAELTHVFHYDSVTLGYSSNLLYSALPYYLFPNPLKANDFLYFINQSGTEFSGPFNNIVLHLNSVPQLITSYSWWYWNGGAWMALSVHDYAKYELGSPNDDGLFMINFVPPSDWTPRVTNGVNGLAIALGINGVLAPGQAPPQQTSQQVYTVTWPYLQIPATSVTGDIPAVASLTIQNLKYNITGTTPDQFRNLDTIYMGLRSLSRGEEFSAYINISDVQRSQYINLISMSADGTFVADINAPTGRAYRYARTSVIDNDPAVTIQFGEHIHQYYGTYRVFLRGRAISGAPEELDFQLTLSPDLGPWDLYWASSIKNWEGNEIEGVIDFGELTIPPYRLTQDEDLYSLLFNVYITKTGSTATMVHLYDIILIPVDEWFAAAKHVYDPTTAASYIIDRDGIEIDSVKNPKYKLRSFGIEGSDMTVRYTVRVDGSPVIFQSNEEQRLWFFVLSSQASSALRTSHPDLFHSAHMKGANRYFSMRGAT